MFRVLFLFVFTMMLSTASAQDLSDNEVCMECHEPTATVVHEYHIPDWSCVDCHDYVENIEHEDTAPGNEVDCLNCHDETPTTD